jgi:rhodanese-related sulfurtransferase
MKTEPAGSIDADPTTSFWPQVAGIISGAFLLGVVYNHVSPLGVRSGRPPATAASIPIAVTSPNPAIPWTNFLDGALFEAPTTPSNLMATQPPPATVPSPTPTSQAQPIISSLTWPEVKTLLDAGKIILVDARFQANYDLGHIPGAVLLPATSPAEELQAFAAKYPKNTALVTYCGSDTCHMSHQLAESLIKICGYTNVSNMPGGYAEFQTSQPPLNPPKP